MRENLNNLKKTKVLNRSPKVMITFQKDGKNGGPYVSHMRIMNSCLKEQYDFIPLYVPRFRVLIRPTVLFSVIRDIHKASPDIYHFEGLQLTGFSFLLLAKMSGVKISVCAVHGSSQNSMKIGKFAKSLVKMIENWTLRHSTIVYGVSKFVSEWDVIRNNARQCYGHIYNMPITRVLNSNKNIRREFGISNEETIVVSTGRIVEDKGYGVLKDVICGRKEWKNVKFLIVGNGSYLEDMCAAVKERELQNCVLFTGYREDIPEILAASDIFIICTYHETFCNSVVEASGMGLPVIATNTGGIPEIVEDHVSGMLVEAGNVGGYTECLDLLISHPQLRLKMGNQGKRIVQKKFSEEVITRNLGDLYEQLLSNTERKSQNRNK